MKVAVLGCGAVGGVIAASLTRAGHDVTPIVSNAEIARALSKHGFRLSELPGPQATIPLLNNPAIAAQDARTTFDVVICATPSTALETALRQISPFLAPGAVVVTC